MVLLMAPLLLNMNIILVVVVLMVRSLFSLINLKIGI